jgi:iron(III) transport system permease protein
MRRAWLSPGHWLFGAVAFVVGYLTLTPLAFLIYQSFRTPSTPTRPGRWTLDNYLRAFVDLNRLDLLGNSLIFAVGAAALAVTVGTAMAWVNERTNTPLRTLFFSLSLVPMIMPGLLFSISWVFLLSPDIGLINRVLATLFQLREPALNIYSLAGMIWVEGLQLSPLVFLLVASSFRSMDPALEESAQVSGATIPETLRYITLRLAWPSIFGVGLIAFIRGIEAFEVPAVIGLPVGVKVFTSEIYTAMHSYPPDLGKASAHGMVLLMITTLGVYCISWMTREQSRYATVTGKGFRPRQIDLGPWRYVTAGSVLFYFLLVIVLPLVVLLWTSFQPFYNLPSLQAIGQMSLKNFQYVLAYPKIVRSVLHSVLLGAATATAVMLLTAVITWLTIRSRHPLRWLLDNVAFLPVIFPGLIMGVAVMVVYLNLPVRIYGTLWVLLIAYVTVCLPYGTRYNTASMIQIHKELEESAQMSGATRFQQFRHITLPLLKPGIMAGWIAVFIISVRLLSVSILLYGPGSEVLPVTIWELWKNAQQPEVSALGVMLIALLVVVASMTHEVSRRFGVRD